MCRKGICLNFPPIVLVFLQGPREVLEDELPVKNTNFLICWFSKLWSLMLPLCFIYFSNDLEPRKLSFTYLFSPPSVSCFLRQRPYMCTYSVLRHVYFQYLFNKRWIWTLSSASLSVLIFFLVSDWLFYYSQTGFLTLFPDSPFPISLPL